jgi:hypothetical protein
VALVSRARGNRELDTWLTVLLQNLLQNRLQLWSSEGYDGASVTQFGTRILLAARWIVTRLAWRGPARHVGGAVEVRDTGEARVFAAFLSSI